MHAPDPQPGARFVDQVDRLVGKVTVGDVTVGHVGCGHDRLVGDRDAVVGLVAIAQTLEDLDRVRNRRLFHLDGLEPTLEGRVLLEVLAVLVESGGPDRLQLAARQHRLEDARSIDRTFGRACTHERVQLVDEEDHVAACLDLLEHLLEPLFEVAAVTRPGNQRAEVEGVELLALDRFGHVADDDVVGETFDNRSLANSRLTDEHGVVLRAARQHLHHALDFLLAPDDRVELLLAGELREVATELVEDERAARLRLTRRATLTGLAFLLTRVAREQLDHLLTDAGQIRPEFHEHLRGDAFAFANQPEQDVLSADVVVSELQRLAQRELKDLLGARRERDVARGSLPAVADDLFDLRRERLRGRCQATRVPWPRRLRLHG